MRAYRKAEGHAEKRQDGAPARGRHQQPPRRGRTAIAKATAPNPDGSAGDIRQTKRKPRGIRRGPGGGSGRTGRPFRFGERPVQRWRLQQPGKPVFPLL